MKEWHFYDKVYRRWVVLVVGSFGDFKKFLDKGGYKYVDDLKDARGMCIVIDETNNDIGNNCYVLWLRQWTMSDLVHEVTHLATLCLDDVGVEITRNNTEALAFYVEYWFKEMTTTKKRLPAGRSHTRVES